jgi:hypothetical protein
MSGDGGSAGLKSDADGVQMNELSVGREVEKFNGLRQQQDRRRRKQRRVGHRHDGTDRASVVRMPVGIVIDGGLLLRGPSLRRGEPIGTGSVGLRCVGLKRCRCLRGDPVEVSERKRKLDRQREQRQPRSLLDMRSEPLHAGMRLRSEARGISAAPTL